MNTSLYVGHGHAKYHETLKRDLSELNPFQLDELAGYFSAFSLDLRFNQLVQSFFRDVMVEIGQAAEEKFTLRAKEVLDGESATPDECREALNSKIEIAAKSLGSWIANDILDFTAEFEDEKPVDWFGVSEVVYQQVMPPTNPVRS